MNDIIMDYSGLHGMSGRAVKLDCGEAVECSKLPDQYDHVSSFKYFPSNSYVNRQENIVQQAAVSRSQQLVMALLRVILTMCALRLSSAAGMAEMQRSQYYFIDITAQSRLNSVQLRVYYKTALTL